MVQVMSVMIKSLERNPYKKRDDNMMMNEMIYLANTEVLKKSNRSSDLRFYDSVGLFLTLSMRSTQETIPKSEPAITWIYIMTSI
jgi:hypothetical protein